MLAEERRKRITELVRDSGFASLDSLVAALEVSESTIRRDLAHLEQAGLARRTHGGVFYTGSSPNFTHFRQNQSNNSHRKHAIASFAASMVRAGDTVILDGGSTTYGLAQQLLGMDIQVVTNSLPVANLLSGSDRTEVVLIGGFLHGKTGVVLGPLAIKSLENVYCRFAFISVAGLDSQNLYNSNQLLVETERAMMLSADQTVVLADSSKFGRKGMTKLGDYSSIHQIISDSDLAESWKENLIGKAQLDIAQIDSKMANPL